MTTDTQHGAWCVCGHHSHVHASDPSGMAGSPCWESLDGRTDKHGYPINVCPCGDYTEEDDA